MREPRCADCKRLADTPMLKDELWAQVSPGTKPDLLCIECVEFRLGRTIYTEDLNSSLWSICIKQIVKRELARKELSQ